MKVVSRKSKICKLMEFELQLRIPKNLILILIEKYKWDKVFKNGSSKICERQPLKNWKADFYQFFKGCLPQIPLEYCVPYAN